MQIWFKVDGVPRVRRPPVLAPGVQDAKNRIRPRFRDDAVAVQRIGACDPDHDRFGTANPQAETFSPANWLAVYGESQGLSTAAPKPFT